MKALRFLVPLFLTVAFEAGGAFLLGIRERKKLLLILLTNMLTNPCLTLCGALLYRHLPMPAVRLIVYALLEPLIILAEGRIYQSYLEEEHPYRISFILNVISIAGGILWNWLQI